MGIDEEKLLIQADKVREASREIAAILSSRGEGLKSHKLSLAATERYLQISIESCINIGNHIISGLGLKRADSYRDVFRRLSEAGLIEEECLDDMLKAVKFRNRLVHVYWEVLPEEVYEFSSLIVPGISSFLGQILGVLKKKGLIS